MGASNNKTRTKNNLGVLLRWHRYLGLTVALFVALLAISGLMLNHTEALGLDTRFVKNELVLSRYGIKTPQQITSYQVKNHWIHKLGHQLYFDTKRLPGDYRELVGAMQMADIIVVALENQLLLFTEEGDLIEAIGPAEGAPGTIAAIALAPDNGLYVKGGHGIYHTGEDLLEWRQLTSKATTWAQPTTPPEAMRLQLIEQWRGQSLTFERVVLDLHSGRFFGSWGVWIMDLAALVMLGLAATGCYMWWRSRPKPRR